MSIGTKQDNDGKPAELPGWADCDFFCIHHYAGTGDSPCGWRGQLRDVHHDEVEAKLLCPRCGRATLLRIPLERADETDA